MVKPLEKSIKFWDGHGLLRIVELHVGEGTETDIARRKGGHGGGVAESDSVYSHSIASLALIMALGLNNAQPAHPGTVCHLSGKDAPTFCGSYAIINGIDT